ncbi:pyridoxamine 5'-phosphate oxidase family protein [Methylobacterium nigriterrae]|uniref:pyridoxamine 5'-phosphate oxidase family protein n=1 Tax=Methylobacterium nigriterrae TaxID=3127512 RepID=UPI00301419C0
MRAPLPAFYDDLAAAEDALWRLLAEGVGRAGSAFHLPSLATVDAAGRPRVRTVVLRAAERAAGTLRVHCDRRSGKAAEIAARGFCALHAYDPGSAVQIRVEGRASLHAADAVAEAAWAESRPMSRACYGIAPGPGTALPRASAYALPDPDGALGLGRPNFCAILVQAECLDLLYLDRRGHRRAGWTRGEEGWTGRWLVP